MGWMAEAFDEGEKLALFAVRKDMAWIEPSRTAAYESSSAQPVDPAAVLLVTADLDAEPDIHAAIERAAALAQDAGSKSSETRGFLRQDGRVSA